MYGNISELLGKTILDINVFENRCITFKCSDGDSYNMYHVQDCCESVSIEDINGDLFVWQNDMWLRVED